MAKVRNGGDPRADRLELVRLKTADDGGLDDMFDISLDPQLQNLWVRAKLAAGLWPTATSPTAAPEALDLLQRLRAQDPEKATALAQTDLRVDVLAQVQRDRELDGKLKKTRRRVGDVDTGEVAFDKLRELMTVHGRAGDVVTGTVAFDKLRELRSHCHRLKATSAVRPQLHHSTSRVLGATPGGRAAAGAAGTAPTGRGVIVGIVDFGFDLAHPNFRDARGRTRVLRFWDQGDGRNLVGPPPAKAEDQHAYGCKYSRTDINRSLRHRDIVTPIYKKGRFVGNRIRLVKAERPHAPLAYDIGKVGHGTHVADIAAGNGRATGAPGVAPDADLVLVQLPRHQLENTELVSNSRFVLEAVAYIFDVASRLGKPAVVNLSIGTQSGPHDGGSLIEEAMESMLTSANGAVVVAAGNGRLGAAHAVAALYPSGSGKNAAAIGWRIEPDDPSHNAAEIWYSLPRTGPATDAGPVAISLKPPGGGRSLGAIKQGAAYAICRRGAGDSHSAPITGIADAVRRRIPVVGIACHREAYRSRKRRRDWGQLLIALEGSAASGGTQRAPAGVWKIRAVNSSGERVAVHTWLQRDAYRELDADEAKRRNAPRPSYFEGAEQRSTLSSLAGAERMIVVGAARLDGDGMAAYSASGPTRNGRRKPDVCAPGEHAPDAGIIAAKAGTRVAWGMTGTSMAAPHVTGVVALLLQAAAEAKVDLTAERIRDLIVAGAKAASGGRDWDPRAGYGMVNAAESLRLLRKQRRRGR